MNKFIYLFVTTFLIAPLVAFANDTAFGGEGAAPIPIKQTQVAMLNEHIIISGREIERSDMKGSWDVNCNYTFKNTANLSQSFKMGFPFPVNDELGETTTPAGYTSIKNGPLVHDFTLTINDKPATVTQQKIAPILDEGMNYQDAYLWDIKMTPNQIVKIQHHYITGVTVNSVGQYYVTFVLKTGGLWKGATIGSSQLEVIPNTPTRLCSELDKTADYLTPKPPGITISGQDKNRKYSWNLQNFQPKDDLELCLITAKNYIRYYVVYPISQVYGTINLNKMSAAQLKILRNTIYAQYGKQFETLDLQTYFDKQWWYEKNPNYTDNLLNDEDKKAIALVLKAEART